MERILYRVDALSTLDLTVTGTIMPSLKTIGTFKHDKITLRTVLNKVNLTTPERIYLKLP